MQHSPTAIRKAQVSLKYVLRITIITCNENANKVECHFLQNDDQLFPFYVMQTVGNLRGIPGLFIAGIFGAALR